MIDASFWAGLALGGAGILATALICKAIMQRQADAYEARIIARDNRIRGLLKELEGIHAKARREALVSTIREPLGRR